MNTAQVNGRRRPAQNRDPVGAAVRFATSLLRDLRQTNVLEVYVLTGLAKQLWCHNRDLTTGRWQTAASTWRAAERWVAGKLHDHHRLLPHWKNSVRLVWRQSQVDFGVCLVCRPRPESPFLIGHS